MLGGRRRGGACKPKIVSPKHPDCFDPAPITQPATSAGNKLQTPGPTGDAYGAERGVASERARCRDWTLRWVHRPRGELGDWSRSRGRGSGCRIARPDLLGPGSENSARVAAPGGRCRPRVVTGPPAAPTLTLRRLGSRARPPQPPGRLPRPQRGKQPPALLAALLSCSHLCAHAPPRRARGSPPAAPAAARLPVPGRLPGRRGRRGRSLRRGGRVGGGGGRGRGDSCWGGACGCGRPGRGRYCDALGWDALGAWQPHRGGSSASSFLQEVSTQKPGLLRIIN